MDLFKAPITFIIALVINISFATSAQCANVIWDAFYNSGTSDTSTSVDVDLNDDVYVSVISGNTNYIRDFRLIKYTQDGAKIWETPPVPNYIWGEFHINKADEIVVIANSGTSLIMRKYNTGGTETFNKYIKEAGLIGFKVSAANRLAVLESITNLGYFLTWYDESGSQINSYPLPPGNYKLVGLDTQDNTLLFNYDQNIFLKLSTSGEILWQKSIGQMGLLPPSEGSVLVWDKSFVIDNNDNILVGMRADSTSLHYLGKANPEGNAIWVTQTDPEIYLLWSITTDRQGNIIGVGESTPWNASKCYIYKYSPNGRLIWKDLYSSKKISFPYGFFYSAAVDSRGDVIAFGTGASTWDGYSDTRDVVIVKYAK